MKVDDAIAEWINCLEIFNFDELKELIVIDQIAEKYPLEVREHFVDDLPKIKTDYELVNKLDDYEVARHNKKGVNQNLKKILKKKVKERMRKFKTLFSLLKPRQLEKETIWIYDPMTVKSNCLKSGNKFLV